MSKKFKIEISCDDGYASDLDIAKKMSKLELRCTFYIPNQCMLNKEQIKKLSEEHEIGGHTVNHPQDLRILSDEDLKYEIEMNKEYLENIIGKKITKFCYPRGRFDDRVVEAVKNAGYEYARTTKVLNIEHPKDLFRVNTTIHAYPDRSEYNGKSWYKIARQQFLIAKTKNGYFHLWFHSREVRRHKQNESLKILLKLISRNKTGWL